MAFDQVKSFDDVLASLPPQEKLNFLAACRLVYDSNTCVLRGLCGREHSKFKLPLPTMNKLKKAVKLEKNEFSALVDHLLYRKRKADHECGSFFKKVSCKFIIFDKADGTKCLELKPVVNNSSVTLKAGGQVQIPSEKDHISLEEFEGSRYCIPFRNSIKDGASVDVYLPTEAWYCVNEFRIMRNKHLGHNCAVNLTDNDLEDMFKCVKGAYEKLAIHELSNAEKIYKELQEIETSYKDWSVEGVQSALMDYKQRVGELWQELNDRVDVMEEKLGTMKAESEATKDTVCALKTESEATKDTVCALKTESEATKDTVCALETKVCTVETMFTASNCDTQERFSKLERTAAVGMNHVDGIKEDLHSLKENAEERLRKLEAKDSSRPINNYFGGQGNTVYLQQNLYTAGGSGPQPGAAQQCSYAASRQSQPLQLRSGRFASGPPTQDEIEKLSEAIVKCPTYLIRQANPTKIGETLGIQADVIASIRCDSSEPGVQVSKLLTQWVKNTRNNTRDQLYELLGSIKLSSPAEGVFYK